MNRPNDVIPAIMNSADDERSQRHKEHHGLCLNKIINTPDDAGAIIKKFLYFRSCVLFIWHYKTLRVTIYDLLGAL